MKNLYTYLSSKGVTAKEFENKACVILEDNDSFIPFATKELMQYYSIPSNCELEVSMILAKILGRNYTFAKRN